MFGSSRVDSVYKKYSKGEAVHCMAYSPESMQYKLQRISGMVKYSNVETSLRVVKLAGSRKSFTTKISRTVQMLPTGPGDAEVVTFGPQMCTGLSAQQNALLGGIRMVDPSLIEPHQQRHRLKINKRDGSHDGYAKWKIALFGGNYQTDSVFVDGDYFMKTQCFSQHTDAVDLTDPTVLWGWWAESNNTKKKISEWSKRLLVTLSYTQKDAVDEWLSLNRLTARKVRNRRIRLDRESSDLFWMMVEDAVPTELGGLFPTPPSASMQHFPCCARVTKDSETPPQYTSLFHLEFEVSGESGCCPVVLCGNSDSGLVVRQNSEAATAST